MMTPQPPASIHYTGLDGLWKSATLWGLVGMVCQAISPAPLRALVGVILGGLVTGGVCAWWLLKLRLGWINPTRLAALGILLVSVVALAPGASALASLAMGSFLYASFSLAFLILGKRALAKLNKDHGPFLESVAAAPDAPPPLERDADSTRQAFLAALPPPLRDEIAATFTPGIVIDPGEVTDDLPSEASCFGGPPALEPGTPWPSRDGRPMDFLARINLAEVAALLPAGSPRAGWLSFFYDPQQPWGNDPEDLGSGCILFSPDPAACRPVATDRPHPPRQAIRFRRVIIHSLPDELEDRFYTHWRSLNAKEKARLDVLHDRAMESASFDNRLLSPPDPVQNSMDSDLQSAAQAYGLPLDTPWTMVLQLDSVSEQDWCWGDSGCLYFWIPESDWHAARFDRPWVVLQCT